MFMLNIADPPSPRSPIPFSRLKRSILFVDHAAEERTKILRELATYGHSAFFEYFGGLPDDRSMTATQFASTAVVVPKSVDPEYYSILLLAYLRGASILDTRTFLERLRGMIPSDDFDVARFLQNAQSGSRARRCYVRVKSILEPVIALVLLIVLCPVLLGIAVAIKLTGPGPVLYRQARTGHHGRRFILLKFRTMKENAEALGPEWARPNDTRTTPLGAFLRASHLDELPQLWNVLSGTMSFIGPRPERPEFYALMRNDIPLFSLRTHIRPGITGWAQVLGGYAASVDQSKLKLEYDLYYLQNLSPMLDLKILYLTLRHVLQKRGGVEKSALDTRNPNKAA